LKAGISRGSLRKSYNSVIESKVEIEWSVKRSRSSNKVLLKQLKLPSGHPPTLIVKVAGANNIASMGSEANGVAEPVGVALQSCVNGQNVVAMDAC